MEPSGRKAARAAEGALCLGQPQKSSHQGELESPTRIPPPGFRACAVWLLKVPAPQGEQEAAALRGSLRRLTFKALTLRIISYQFRRS